ncbi:hypothetical protein EOM09_06690 [bacterium]|nr:hypothetical protein [bacterium]
MAGEKTEKATLKKRRDAKKEGDVHKSIEVSNTFSLLVITLLVGVYLSHAGTSLVLFLQSSLYITEIEVVFDFRKYLKLFFDTAGVFMIALLAMGLLTNYMQVGFLFTSKKLKPDLNTAKKIQNFLDIDLISLNDMEEKDFILDENANSSYSLGDLIKKELNK